MSREQSQESRRARRIGVRVGAPATLVACVMAAALLTAGPAAARPVARSALGQRSGTGQERSFALAGVAPLDPLAAAAPVAVDAADNPLGQWWKDLDIQKLVSSGMSDLGLSVLGWGANEGAKYLLGHVLDAWGLKSLKDLLIPKSDTTVIIEMLDALNTKVTNLQNSVEDVKSAITEAQRNILFSQTNDAVSSIEDLSKELKVIASLPANASNRIDLSIRLRDSIRTQLIDKGVVSKLNLDLAGGAFSDGVLKATSQVWGSKRFFTHRSSQEIQKVYDYFAVLQFELANLLTEYWSTNPIPVNQGACDAACVKRTIVDKISENLALQKAQVKPELPSNKFIDTRTMLMWDARPQWVSGYGYTPPETCRPHDFLTGANYCTVRPGWTDAHGALLGTDAQFQQLIENWPTAKCGGTRDCANPLDYLQENAGLVVSPPKGTPEDWRGHMWLGPTPVQPYGPTCYVCANVITRINLSEKQRPGPHIFTNILKERDTSAYFASAMTRQSVASGTYWWPLGSK